MIGSLRGKIAHINGDTVTVDVNGVGYEVICTRKAMSSLEMGAEHQLSIHTDVREDSIRLFGFSDRSERQVFLLLNRVSGLGPRSSLDIISQVEVRELLRSIGSGDVAGLMKVKGVGKKKAERIVVELKDIVAQFSIDRGSGLAGEVTVDSGETAPDEVADAVAALEVLGFSKRDAEQALQRAISAGNASPKTSSGDLIREALRHI